MLIDVAAFSDFLDLAVRVVPRDKDSAANGLDRIVIKEVAADRAWVAASDREVLVLGSVPVTQVSETEWSNQEPEAHGFAIGLVRQSIMLCGATALEYSSRTPATLTVNGKSGHSTIKEKGGTLEIFDWGEQFRSSGKTVPVDASALATALRSVVPAASKKEWNWSGVHVWVDAGNLNLAATDRYRLSLHRVPLVQDVSPMAFVLPATAATKIANVLSSLPGEVCIATNPEGSQILFTQYPQMGLSAVEGAPASASGLAILCLAMNLECTPKKFMTILNKERSGSVAVDNEFVVDLQIAQLFAGYRTPAVYLTIGDDDTVAIHAGIGGEHRFVAETPLAAPATGVQVKLAIDLNYLRDAFASWNREEIVTLSWHSGQIVFVEIERKDGGQTIHAVGTRN